MNEPPPFSAFGVKIIGWWGMTETITHGIIGEVDQPNSPMSIGRAAAEYEIRILDDDGSPTRSATPAISRSRACPVCRCSRNICTTRKPQRKLRRTRLFPDRRPRHVCSSAAIIKFGDRAKDMLKVGGENVAASEIEQVIAVIAGVREAAVVAKKHPMLDEVPVVFVIPQAGVAPCRGTADTIMSACRNNLADFKVPREIRFVDEMPRSTLEKVAKAELRKMLAGAQIHFRHCEERCEARSPPPCGRGRGWGSMDCSVASLLATTTKKERGNIMTQFVLPSPFSSPSCCSAPRLGPNRRHRAVQRQDPHRRQGFFRPGGIAIGHGQVLATGTPPR